MTVLQKNEKRKKGRVQEKEARLFIEIEHSFGAVKKTRYRITDFNDFGVSFLVPFNEGYFRVGTPLKYSIIQKDGAKKEYYGVVRYYNPFYDVDGVKYYRVGVQVEANYRDTSGQKLKLRPDRYSSEKTHFKPVVKLIQDNKEYTFDLIDISKYSAAFLCNSSQEFSFKVSDILNSFQVLVKNGVIFEGPVIVNKISLEKTGFTKVVVFPRKNVFNINAFKQIEESETIGAKVSGLFDLIAQNDKIEDSFRVVVSDFRYFLEKINKYLQNPEFAGLNIQESNELLNNLYKAFFNETEKHIKRIEDITQKLNLNEEQYFLYKSYYQEQLHHLLMPSPFMHRMYFKPLGYPGDYVMMKMIFDNGYEGPTLFSKLINKHGTDCQLCVANRNRNRYLCNKLKYAVENIKKPKVKILSVASGPALELYELMKNHTQVSDKISITLLDQEIEALKFSQENIYEERIKLGSQIEVDFIHNTIGGFLRDSMRDKGNIGKYDIIYSFGLFDYFDDITSKKLIERLSKYLAPEGVLLISNFSLDGHWHKTYCEMAFEWYMIYRDKIKLEALARQIKGVKSWKIEEEESRVIKFLEMTFNNEPNQ